MKLTKGLLRVELFLSDLSPIIGYPCHSPTHCCLMDFIDVTLACEDAYLKLVKVVTVADVRDEDDVCCRLGS